jgi:hypothetical protein
VVPKDVVIIGDQHVAEPAQFLHVAQRARISMGFRGA